MEDKKGGRERQRERGKKGRGCIHGNVRKE